MKNRPTLPRIPADRWEPRPGSTAKVITAASVLLGLALALTAGAETNPTPSPGGPQQTWSGTLCAVDPRNHSLRADNWWSPKIFVLGQKCDITAMGQENETLRDLHPGDPVNVTYQELHGVLIADHVTDRSLRFQGTIRQVDPNSGRLTIAQGHVAREFTLADDGRVITASGMDGSLYDLQPGDRAAVIYVRSGRSLIAQRISETTLSYEGKLEAIDLPERIVKTEDPLGEQQFSVADQCQIVVGSSHNAQLQDLKLDHNYNFTYELVNGVKVADRITEVPGLELRVSPR